MFICLYFKIFILKKQREEEKQEIIRSFKQYDKTAAQFDRD
jgi:hypothetical protein